MTIEQLIAKEAADGRVVEPTYLPSLEDIAAHAAAIQSGWSPQERRARARGLEFRAGNAQRSFFGKHLSWTPPTVVCAIGGGQ